MTDDRALAAIRLAALHSIHTTMTHAALVVETVLQAAEKQGYVLVPKSADVFMVNAYRDHENHPARSIQSTWRRMVDAAPTFTTPQEPRSTPDMHTKEGA